MEKIEAQLNDRLYLMTLESFFFTKRLEQHQTEGNKINKDLACSLFSLVEKIEAFIENAEIENENDSNKNGVNDIIPSIDSSVLQAHRYYFCKVCNLSIKSTSAAHTEHLFGNKHSKKLKEYSSKLGEEVKPVIPNRSLFNQSKDKDKEQGSTQSLNEKGNNTEEKKSKRADKKARLNSLPSQVKDLIPGDSLPKRMREFLSTTDVDMFTNSLVREGLQVQKNQKHLRVCDLLRRRLSCKYPKVQIYPFGSYIIGLGHEKADIDIFIDLENCFYEKLSKRKMKDSIFQVQRLLANSPDLWTDFEPVGNIYFISGCVTN